MEAVAIDVAAVARCAVFATLLGETAGVSVWGDSVLQDARQEQSVRWWNKICAHAAFVKSVVGAVV